MAKFRQSFTRTQMLYKLDDKRDILVEQDTPEDLQKAMNSRYDETLFYNLERFYEASSVEILDGIDSDDYGGLSDLTGSNADKLLRALLKVEELRNRYEIPVTFTNTEILDYIRARAKNNVTQSKGGEANEPQTKNESQSETQQRSE